MGGREVFHFGCGVERLQVLLQGDSYRIDMLFTIADACLNKYPSLRERNNHDSKNTFLLALAFNPYSKFSL